MKIKAVFLLLPCCVTIAAGTIWSRGRNSEDIDSDEAMDVSELSVYYDIETNETITKMMPRPWYKPGWMLRLPFTGGKCTCEQLKCTCCTGIRIQAFKFDRQTCMILTFEPQESMLDLEVQMNNSSIYRNSFSARNPPPFCVPIPVPYLPPGLVDMCVRLFDIAVIEQMLHVCMDVDTRVDRAPVLVLHFDCMDMGAGGVSLSKPGGSTVSPVNSSPEGNSTTQEPEQLDSDVLDPVVENSVTTTQPVFNATVRYI